MLKSQKKLGEILIAKGLINPQQLQEALDEQRRTKEFLGQIFLKKHWLNEQDLLEVLSEQFNIPWANLSNKYMDWNFMRQFSSSLVLDYKCIPLRKDEFSVVVAIANPLDVWALKKAEEEVRPLQLKVILASQKDIQDVVGRYQEYLRSNIAKMF